MPSASANRLRRSGTKRTVIDGPFAETKESVAGFASLKAESKSNCIEVTKPYLALGVEGDSDPFVTLRQSNTNFTRMERDFHNSSVGKHVVCLLDKSQRFPKCAMTDEAKRLNNETITHAYGGFLREWRRNSSGDIDDNSAAITEN